jgi:hypothetical protein
MGALCVVIPAVVHRRGAVPPGCAILVLPVEPESLGLGPHSESCHCSAALSATLVALAASEPSQSIPRPVEGAASATAGHVEKSSAEPGLTLARVPGGAVPVVTSSTIEVQVGTGCGCCWGWRTVRTSSPPGA